MFQLMLTTCFAGILCFSDAPAVQYATAEQCLHQGAILSGITRVDMELGHMPQATKIECQGIDGSTQIVTYDYGNRRIASIPAEDALSLPTSR